MKSDSETVFEQHGRLLESLQASGRLKTGIGGVRQLESSDYKPEVADAPSRSLILDAMGKPFAVLFVSAEIDAVFVARGVEKAAIARQMLGEELVSVILNPITDGDFEGRSFAIWPWHRPPIATRGLAYIQKYFLLRRLQDWLFESTARTARDPNATELADTYLAPLTLIAEGSRFPQSWRENAQHGLNRLKSGKWRPRVVLQHKEITWNVLLPHGPDRRKNFPRGFILVDWAGTNLSGYPFLNLMGLARNYRMSDSTRRAELTRHCRELACETQDILSYMLAGTGFNFTHLGHFPESDLLEISTAHLKHAGTAIRELEPAAA